MTVRALVISVVFVAATAVTALAQQPPRVDWNARAPWRVWDTPPNAPGDPESRAANKRAPFKIFDNVYYVGLHNVSTFLVTTSAGLVLIDASYPDSGDYVLQNVRTLGFDPMTITYVFVSHAHGDHSGGAPRIQQVTKARVGMSAEDWTVFERGTQAKEMKRDLVLKDGETITVGDTPFTFYVSPGHTPGALTSTFPARDGSRRHTVLSPGGLGLAFAPEWTAKYIASLERLKTLGPFDVLLPNHPYMTTGGLFAQVQALAARKASDPHPVVLGSAKINAFLDTALTVARQKLTEEQRVTRP